MVKLQTRITFALVALLITLILCLSVFLPLISTTASANSIDGIGTWRFKGVPDTLPAANRMTFNGYFLLPDGSVFYLSSFYLSITTSVSRLYFNSNSSSNYIWSSTTGYTDLFPVGSELYIIYVSGSNLNLSFFTQFFEFVNSTPYPLDSEGGSYEEGYNAGYSDGFSAGDTAGYNRGHDEGYESGYDVGYENGMSVGHDAGYEEGYHEGALNGVDDFLSGASTKTIVASTSNLRPVDYLSNAAGGTFNLSTSGQIGLGPKRPTNGVVYSPAYLWSFDNVIPAGTVCSLSFSDLSPLGNFGPTVDNVWHFEYRSDNGRRTVVALTSDSTSPVSFTAPFDLSSLYIVVWTGGETAYFGSLELSYTSDLEHAVYNVGYNDGLKQGYDDGLKASNNTVIKTSASYTAGYSDGVTAAGDYTFASLMGSVFDAPLNAFRGLFNFEILGVNLTAFLSALFIVCIVITAVRLCLGG